MCELFLASVSEILRRSAPQNDKCGCSIRQHHDCAAEDLALHLRPPPVYQGISDCQRGFVMRAVLSAERTRAGLDRAKERAGIAPQEADREGITFDPGNERLRIPSAESRRACSDAGSSSTNSPRLHGRIPPTWPLIRLDRWSLP